MLTHKLRHILAAIAGALSTIAAPVAHACDHNDENGLDVALVLSGGGAFTTTQVGAMTVIEELGIPIHCVIGTSMGSVTGAMYAAGYSAEEIAGIYKDRDWNAIFRGGIERPAKPYLQKENEDQYFSDYVAGISTDGLTLPGGLGDMSGLQAAFRQIFASLPNDIDFSNNLRIPFRATAMDLSTGEAVSFDKGDLVQSIMASMAVPGLFAPRQIDGQLYIDGGMASQLSIRAAKEMGADIIIALDTTVAPPELNGAQSIASTSQQIVRITVFRNWQQEIALLEDDDLLIQPDLTGLSTGNFNLAEQGLASGKAEADLFREQLLAIKARAAPPHDRKMTPDIPFETSGDLILVNKSVISDGIIRDRVRFEEEDINSGDKINERLRNLASFGAFGDVDLARTANGAQLTVEPRALGRNLLQAGFRASTTFDGDAEFALLARLSRRPIGKRGGEASFSAEIGTDFGFTAQFYQPFGKSGAFFAVPSLSYRGEEILFDIADFRVGEFFEQRGTAQLRIGRELGKWGIISVEGLTTIGRIEPQVSVDPTTFVANNFQQAGVGAFFGVDTLNRSAWPTAGVQIQASGQRLFDLGNDGDTDKFNVFATTAFEFGKFGLQLRAQAEGVFEDSDRPVEILDLGGFRRLSAFTESSLPNNQYILGSAEIFRRLTAADGIVNFPVYVGSTFEYANIQFDLFEQGVRENVFAGSVYIGAETILGPTFLGTGYSDDGNFSVFLHFGRAF